MTPIRPFELALIAARAPGLMTPMTGRLTRERMTSNATAVAVLQASTIIFG
ncbi:hypothetical protein D3C73_1612050 [compost metagenome]